MRKIFFLIILFIEITVQSQTFNRRIDTFLKDLDIPNSSGYSIGIIKDNRLIYSSNMGLSDVEHNIRITSKTDFIIGSLTKQFIGYGIAILIDKRKIGFNDDIRLYLPDFPYLKDTIRIKHLIYHTSGLYDYNEMMKVCDDSYNDFNNEGMIKEKVYGFNSTMFKSGDKYEYNNSGYYLLSKIIEQVSGLSINDFSKQYIFDSIGMNDTYFYDNPNKPSINLAFSYLQDIKGEYKRLVSGTPPFGAGNLCSNLDDLIKWEQHFYSNSNSNVCKMILEKGILNNGDTLKYCFGLKTGVYKNKNVLYHFGDYNGFNSVIVRVPEYKMSVLILSNDKKAKTIIDNYSLASRLIDILIDSTANPKLPDIRCISINSNKRILDYTGIYESDKGKVFVNFDDEQLKISYSFGNWYYSIYPISDSIFNDEYDYGFLYKFRFDNNKVVGLWTKYTGFMQKVGSENLSKISTDCIGTYYSKELNTVYKLDFVNGELFCKINSKCSRKLIVLGIDMFRNKENTIKLIRNASTKIEYLIVNERYKFEKIN